MSVKKKREPENDPAPEAAPQGEGGEAPQTPVSEGTAAAAQTTEAAQHAPEAQEGGEVRAVDVVAGLEAKIAELEATLADTRDQLLRRMADFDNARKRLLRDKEESVKYANTALLTDLVESIDSMEKAIQSAETSRDFDSLHQGVSLIEKQLMGNLERKWGLQRMAARGEAFDPTFHQAVSVGPAAEDGRQIVLEELQSGYILNGRVLRPARVVVSAPGGSGGAGAVGQDPAGQTSSADGV